MKLYDILEKPQVYNLHAKIASFNNKTLLSYIDKLVNAKKGDKVLDVGCGTGRYAIFSCKYFGIDTNEDYIKYAKKHHVGTFLKMDGTDLKFSDNTFDSVLNMSTLHHVSDEATKKMIVEMKRVCKKGGHVYIIDAVYPKKINFLGYLLFKFDRGRYRRTFEELEAFLSKYHFKIVSSNIRKTFPYRWAVFSYLKK